MHVGTILGRSIKSALYAPPATKMVPVLHEFFPQGHCFALPSEIQGRDMRNDEAFSSLLMLFVYGRQKEFSVPTSLDVIKMSNIFPKDVATTFYVFV